MRALILGDTVAALKTAKRLCRRGVDVTLVSPREFCYFFEAASDVATGAIAFEDAVLPMARVAKRHGFDFVHDTIKAILPAQKKVRLAASILTYEALIVALGTVPHVFEGMEFALMLGEKPGDALVAHHKLAALWDHPHPVMVCGATDARRAKSHAVTARMLKNAFEAKHKPSTIYCTAPVIEASLARMLTQEGIIPVAGEAIQAVTPRSVIFGTHELACDAVVLASRPKAHPLAEKLGCNAEGFVVVDEVCRTAQYEGVYALGSITQATAAQTEIQIAALCDFVTRQTMPHTVWYDVATSTETLDTPIVWYRKLRLWWRKVRLLWLQ